MSSIDIIMILLLVGNIFISVLCLSKLGLIEGSFFGVIKDFCEMTGTQTKAIEDIKLIMMKAYNVDEMPKPGTFQTKIKPTVHSNTELYDMEKSK